MSIDEIVTAGLAEAGADEATRDLWSQIYDTFGVGGPDAVKQLLRSKVRESQRRAEKEAKAVRTAAAVVVRPKRAAKRRKA